MTMIIAPLVTKFFLTMPLVISRISSLLTIYKPIGLTWKMLINNFHRVDLEDLDIPLLDQEVVQALFSFKPFKAPRPDDLHHHFFQYHWNIVSKSILECCHEIFTTQVIIGTLNHTFLCLIPKFKNTNLLKNIRLIGLCNTIYKIVTKIIENW